MKLNIEVAYCTAFKRYGQNSAYQKDSIEIHSIGCAQSNAEAVRAGMNKFSPGGIVNAIVDCETEGKVLEILPKDNVTWADAGYGNQHSYTIEMCESKYMKYTSGANYTITDQVKFIADIKRGYATLVAYAAKLCKDYGFDPTDKLSNGLHRVYSHDEGRQAGLSSAHVDVSHLWPKIDKDMDIFRDEVKAAMTGKTTVTISSTTQVWYRVRKKWTDRDSQLGAYESMDNAKANCPVGYSVFDKDGEAVYTAEWKASGVPPSKQDFIDSVAKIAQELYKETRILPSVVIAQCCLESGYGLGTDNLPLTEVNNILGMKTDLINSTWSDYTVWGGKSITKLTPEEYNGVTKMVNAPFRVYTDYENCIRDYEAFLLHVKNGAGYKYRAVQGKTDPKEVITIISKGGYATDSSYITSVMRVLNENNFIQYDAVVQSKDNVNTEKESAPVTILEAADKIRKQIENDKDWKYSNKGTYQASTFENAIKEKKHYTSCTLGIMWALRMIGVLKAGTGSFYGKNGGLYWGGSSKAQMSAAGYVFTDLKGKYTVSQAVKKDLLKPGDIVTYSSLSHTNLYAGSGKWYDFGHGYSGTIGEQAKITKVYGGTIYGDQKVAWVLHKEEAAENTYRVRIGIYQNDAVRENTAAELKKNGFKTFSEAAEGGTALYCGSYSSKENAVARVKELQKVKISGKYLSPVIVTK